MYPNLTNSQQIYEYTNVIVHVHIFLGDVQHTVCTEKTGQKRNSIIITAFWNDGGAAAVEPRVNHTGMPNISPYLHCKYFFL